MDEPGREKAQHVTSLARAGRLPAGARHVLYSAGFEVNQEAHLTGYLPVVLFLGLIVAFAVVSLGMAAVLRPARPYWSKLENYECGAEPIGEAWVQFPVAFYLVALIFIVFDVLAVFLFPWALVLRGFGLWAVGTMALFIGILSLGWVYAYREGILELK
jgi:NADH-quinone oxidoreductase subunit A